MANDLSQEGEPPPMDFRSVSEDGRYPLGSGFRISMPVDPSQDEAEVRIDFRPFQEMGDILWTLCFPPEPDPISFYRHQAQEGGHPRDGGVRDDHQG